MTKIEALKALIEALKALSGVLAEENSAVTQELKLEDVRAVLAEISRSGRTSEMKNLLERFGANKLSDVAPEKYPALLAAAKEISNA